MKTLDYHVEVIDKHKAYVVTSNGNKILWSAPWRARQMAHFLNTGEWPEGSK